MKTLLSIIGFFFLMFTIGAVLLLWKVRRRMRDIRQVMEDNLNDEDFQRMANKYFYRDKKGDEPQFDDDYFKGDSNDATAGSAKKKQSRRTMRAAGGVTIIDDRDPSVAQRKIFTHDEGEYVDFKEV